MRWRLPYPVKRGRIAYVVRDDVARATAAAALSPGTRGEVLELAGPTAISMTEPPLISQILISLYRAVDAGDFDLPPQ